MKVLVTTPNGKVGHEVAKQLLAKKVPVRIAAHTVEKAKKEFSGAEVVHFDYADAAGMGEALKGITHVYLAQPAEQAAAPTQQFIDLAKKAGVKRVVMLSAMGVENADAAPLRQVEKRLEASGMEWTIGRPNWFMQNFSTMHAAAIRGGTLAEPAANGKTAFIDVRDIAAVAVAALTGDGHAGKAYALTGPEPLTREDVVRRIGQAIGKPVKYAALTDEQFRAAMKPYVPAAGIEILSSLYATVRAGWTERVTDDVQRVLGRAPIGFDQFARDNRAAWA